jgi:hypothetical protein
MCILSKIWTKNCHLKPRYVKCASHNPIGLQGLLREYFHFTLLTTWQTNATEKKNRLMPDVSSVVEIFLRLTRDVRSTRTHKRKHAHLSVWNNTLFLHKSNKSYALKTRVTYAPITKQNSYAATNIGQDPHINQPHQQTSETQRYTYVCMCALMYVYICMNNH